MPTIAFALPIAPGKTERVRAASNHCLVERRTEFEASRARLGIRGEHGFIQQTAQGDLAIVVLTVDDPARVFEGIASSAASFDIEFRTYLLESFGWDATKPPPSPPPEQVFAWPAP